MNAHHLVNQLIVHKGLKLKPSATPHSRAPTASESSSGTWTMCPTLRTARLPTCFAALLMACTNSKQYPP